MPRVCIIVAHGPDGAIGLGGGLPWPHHREDMRRFRNATLGKPIIMGRKTWESLDGGLPYRHNIVLTSNPSAVDPLKADVAPNMGAAIKLAGRGDVFVIGGSKVFAAALPYATRYLITQMEGRWPGDVYFKVPFLADKTLLSDEAWQDEDPNLNCRFLEYVNK